MFLKLIVIENTITGSYNNQQLFFCRGGLASRYPKTRILPTFSAIANRQNRQVLRRFSIFRVAHLRTSFKNTFFCFDEKIALRSIGVTIALFDFGTQHVIFFSGALLDLLKNVFFAFFNDFSEANFLTKEQAETMDLLVFFVARVPRCDLSLM